MASSEPDAAALLAREVEEVRASNRDAAGLFEALKLPHALAEIALRPTRVKHLVVRVQALDTYPGSALLVECRSDTLPDALVPRLRAGLAGAAEKACVAGEPQLQAVAAAARETLEGNRLVCCFDEVARIREAVAGEDSVRVQQRKGTVRMRLGGGRYRATALLSVPEQYPDEPITCRLSGSNYTEEMNQVWQVQADTLIRRLHRGFNPLERTGGDGDGGGGDPDDEAKDGGGGGGGEAPEAITTGSLHAIKSDVKLLHRQNELRAEARDKDGRRALTRFTKKEKGKIEAELEADRAEAERRKRLQFQLGGGEPLPSLAVVALWLHDAVGRLPETACQVCDRPVLPADPAALAAMGEADAARPMRAHCSHWFHRECLDRLLTTPPFAAVCARCGERVSHHQWSTNVAELERSWAAEQARARELAEVADSFL